MTGSECRPSESSHSERIAPPPPLHLYPGQAGETEWWSGRLPEVGRARRGPWFSLPEDGEAPQRVPVSGQLHTTWMAQLPLPQRPVGLQLGGEATGWKRTWAGEGGQGARKDAFPPPGSSSCRCHGYVCFLFDSSQTAEGGGVPAPSSGHRCVGLFTTAACGIPRKRLQTGHPAAAKYPGVKS